MTTESPVAAGDPTEAAADSGHRHLGWALVVICMAQMMVVLDSTIANIALPYIGRDLDISQANLQWVVTGYALVFGGFLLLGGRLGDQWGRRRTFILGLLLFTVASALGGLAQNEAMLLGSRALQGLGAALASPAALALITTTFPPGPERNRAFSVFSAIVGLGAAIGLVLGGWLTGIEPLGIDGWRLTFLINVPIGIISALAAPRLLAESERRDAPLDVPGAIVGTAGLVSLVYGLARAGEEAHGWSDPWTIAALAVGSIMLVSFILIERSVKHPLMPLWIFADKARATAFAAMMITPAAMFAMFFFLSLLVQNVMGYSSLVTGLAFLPFTIGIVGGATLSSRLITRIDPRMLAGTGTILSGFALFMFSRIAVDDSPRAILAAATGGPAIGDSINYWTDIAPFIILMAFGMGLNFVTMTLVAVHGIPSADSGIGSGVLNTMQQVGGALGLATLSTVAVHFTTNSAESIGRALQSLGGPQPSADVQQAVQGVIGQAAFTEGATTAFLVGAFMIWAASAIIWIFLSIKHTELQGDDSGEPVIVH